MIALLGCAAELLPGEVVLGLDVPAELTLGDAGSGLGTSVAWGEGGWLASAPVAGQTWRDGTADATASSWVGWWGEALVVVNAEGEVSADGAAIGTVEGAVTWAIGPPGVLAATARRITSIDGTFSVEQPGVQALAWGEGRVLALACSERCEALAWTTAGEALGAWAEAGDGGAVGEWDGVAWAGDPQWEDPDGAGRAVSEDGEVVDGLPGDHLGIAIGGGHAAGTFNKWVVPARSRVVPLEGGTVKALERGAESQPIALAGDAYALVVGVPFYPAHGQPSGAVVVTR